MAQQQQAQAEVAALAQRELGALREFLAEKDEVLSDDGSVRVASLVSEAVGGDESLEDTRMRVCRVLGRLLAAGDEDERPLSALDAFSADEQGRPECGDAGNTVSAATSGSRSSGHPPTGELP